MYRERENKTSNSEYTLLNRVRNITIITSQYYIILLLSHAKTPHEVAVDHSIDTILYYCLLAVRK